MGRTVAAISRNSSPSSSAESSFRELDDVFLQTQTKIWLGEVLHTRLDDQLSVSDLLADGELLLEVSKIVWTMLLAKSKELRNVKGDKYDPIGSRKSSGRYRPYSNVDSFLKICKILGLNGIDLFSPSDVVEKRDTRKVCICIRSLSKKARSKQLNVPDFDIVTYTVAMPTNLVGCLRSSLERSKSSFTSSAYHTPHRDSKLKFRKQKNPVASCHRNCDSCSDASDEAESNYVGVLSCSSSANYSHDSAWKDSDLENSPGVSSAVRKYTSIPSAWQGEKQGKGNEYEQGDDVSAFLAEPSRSLCSQNVKIDHQLDNTSSLTIDSQTIYAGASYISNGESVCPEMAELDLSDADSGIGNKGFVVGDPLDDNAVDRFYLSHRWAFPDLNSFGADNDNPNLFDGDDSMFNLLLGSESRGSNSTKGTSLNVCGRRSCDEFEDVEVSSVTSMSSVLGRVLNLDFDDQFDVDDPRTAEVNFNDLQNCKADDSLDSTSTRGGENQHKAEPGSPLHSWITDTEESNSESNLKKYRFLTRCSSQDPHNCQSHIMECQEHVGPFTSENGVAQRSLEEDLCLRKEFIISDDAKEINGAAMVERNPIIKEQENNCLPVACNSGNFIGEKFEGSNASGNGALQGSELHSGLKLQDIISKETQASYLVAKDNPVRNHSFVNYANECQLTTESLPCTEGLVDVGKESHQVCIDGKEDVLHCADYMHEDEIEHVIREHLEELSDGREHANARVSRGNPHKRPLLRTVVKGTALFGMLFLFLQLRGRNGSEKGGEMGKTSSLIQKANGMVFTSRKEQKGNRGNGIYPSEKLKFET